MLLSIFTSSLVCAAERITVHDLIGVWTASDEGTNHFMTAEQVRRNCQSFKMIIHADLRLEAITYGDDGGFMFWAVAETPCMLKDNIIACKVNVHTKKRMLSKNNTWHEGQKKLVTKSRRRDPNMKATPTVQHKLTYKIQGSRQTF